MRLFASFLLAASSLMFLVSCSPSDDSSSSGTTESSGINSLNDLAGVWDASYYDSSRAAVDVYYIYIDSDGHVVTYNYFGDNFNKGADCYLVEPNADTLEYISGNTFRSDWHFASLSGAGSDTFIASLDDNGDLVFKFNSCDRADECKQILQPTDISILDLEKYTRCSS